MYNSLPVALLPVLLGPTSRMLPPGLPDHDHTAHNLTITSAEHGPATMGHETNRAVKISNLIKMAAPEQETGGNPGPGPPMGGCNGNSRLVLGFQCSTETYPCTTVTRTCITYPHDPSRVPGWDVMASVWRPLGGEK